MGTRGGNNHESCSPNNRCNARRSSASDKPLRKRKGGDESFSEPSSTVCKYSRRTPHDPDSPPFDWQSKNQSLKTRAAYLYEHKLFCDVTFKVGRGREAQLMLAHKLFLSMGSSVFEAMFSTDWCSQSNKIEIPDVEPGAFAVLLRYLYTDQVSITADTVMSILYAAKKYAVPYLGTKCINFLLSELCPDNAFELLTQARAFDEDDLVEECLKKIDIFAVEAFSSECFTAIDEELLCFILERESLRISEVELFEAVCRWSKAELARRNLPETQENQRSVLEQVVPLVRFPVMTAEDLSLFVKPSGLLSNETLVSLYSYLSLKTKPPIGFNCTPRKPIGRTKKDSAKPMTIEEKEKLRADLKKLTNADLTEVEQFIQSKEASFKHFTGSQSEDLEKMKASTLRSLECIVAFCQMKRIK